MKFTDLLRRSARNLTHAKARTFLTAAALAVGGFTLTITLAAANGARQYTDRLIETNFDPTSLIVAKDESIFSGDTSANQPKEYDSSLSTLGASNIVLKQLDDKDITKIESINGVKSVLPSYQTNAQFVTRADDTSKKFTGSIADYETAAKPEVTAGTLPDTLPQGTALLPEEYVRILGFASPQEALGKSITIQVQQPSGETQAENFTIQAVTKKPATSIDFAGSNILLTQTDAAALDDFVKGNTVAANRYFTVTVKVDGGENKATLTKVQDEIKKAGYGAESVEDTQEFLGQIITILQTIILVFGAITLVASFFGVVNTQYISVLERTREIGLMKALGMSRKSVSRLFIIEATWIGFIGALLGSVLAVGAGVLLNPWISQKLEFGDERLLVFSVPQIALLIVFLMAVTTIAGLLPARKAAKLDPIEALRTE